MSHSIEYVPVERTLDASQKSVSLPHIQSMCARAFGEKIQIESIREFDDGGFNNVYLITLNEIRHVVLRVAPAANTHIPVSDQTLMHNEQYLQPYFAPIAYLMPKTLMVDFTHQILDRDYLFQTFMEGENWAEIQGQLNKQEKAMLWGQLGYITKQIHSVQGKSFGSPCTGPQFSRWSDAVIYGLEQRIKDIEMYSLDATSIRTIVELARNYTKLLDEITQPSLLHGDLWTVNILVKRDENGPRIVAVLDSDRGSWGDPMADWTMFLLGWHRPTGTEAFWEQYGQVVDGVGPEFRKLVYQAGSIVSAFVEAQQHGRKDTIVRGYNDLKNIVTQLHALVG